MNDEFTVNSYIISLIRSDFQAINTSSVRITYNFLTFLQGTLMILFQNILSMQDRCFLPQLLVFRVILGIQKGYNLRIPLTRLYRFLALIPNSSFSLFGNTRQIDQVLCNVLHSNIPSLILRGLVFNWDEYLYIVQSVQLLLHIILCAWNCVTCNVKLSLNFTWELILLRFEILGIVVV